jgi:hypothetical protein
LRHPSSSSRFVADWVSSSAKNKRINRWTSLVVRTESSLDSESLLVGVVLRRVEVGILDVRLVFVVGDVVQADFSAHARGLPRSGRGGSR